MKMGLGLIGLGLSSLLGRRLFNLKVLDASLVPLLLPPLPTLPFLPLI